MKSEHRFGGKVKALLAILSLALSAPAVAAPPTVAFAHVNVVPMDQERVIPDQTVIGTGNVSRAIAPGVRAPKGARVIDGRGKFLSPGLADMHSHSESREDMRSISRTA